MLFKFEFKWKKVQTFYALWYDGPYFWSNCGQSSTAHLALNLTREKINLREPSEMRVYLGNRLNIIRPRPVVAAVSMHYFCYLSGVDIRHFLAALVY